MIDEEDEEHESDILEPTRDLSDQKHASRKRNQDQRDKEEEDSLLRAILNERIGRRYLYRWLQAARTFETNFAVTPDTGFPNQYMTWFLAGQKELGQQLFLSWLKLSPENVKTMLDENDFRFVKPKKQKGYA